MSVKLPTDAPSPRSCQVIKSYPEQEYGFNLHAERGKGQFIGKVDAGSPADIAGLLSGDRIYAVNGASIIDESHKQAVSRIKEDPLKCVLLVIDESGEVWYRERKIAITPNLDNIIHLPRAPPTYEHQQSETPSDSDHISDAPLTYDDHKTHANSHRSQVSETSVLGIDGVRLRPRLACLYKTHDKDEYGFNLHADKGKGHFIGKVDDGSIAQLAGLEEGQRIVGVNGTLIYPNSPHKDVVHLIKQNSMGGELLVASAEIDAWYRTRGLPFSFDDAEQVSSPTPLNVQPSHVSNGNALSNGNTVSNAAYESIGRNGRESVSSNQEERHVQNDVTVISVSNGDHHVTNDFVTDEHVNDEHVPDSSSDHNHEPQEEQATHEYDAPQKHTPPPTVTPSQIKYEPPVSKEVKNGNTNGHSTVNGTVPVSPEIQDLFSMSAAEMREALAARKKRDPKKDNMSLQEKYNIIRNL